MESVRVVKPFVLIITGPCAVGKTSIAKLVAAKDSAEYVSGDEVKKKLFPDVPRITDYPEKLEIVKNELFNEVKLKFNQGASVVVDYVIVDKKQIDKYRDAFGSQLLIRILLPPVEVILERDKKRECWSAGNEIINELFIKFERLKDYLGLECFIDNSEELPELTVKKHFGLMTSVKS